MGFGRGKFGHTPFGHSDFGDDAVVRTFPQSLIENDDGSQNELLLHYLYAIKDSANRVRGHIDMLDEQVDPDKIRADLIKYLGSTIGVVIDSVEPESFQRSLVGQAVQFYRIKGTADSFRVRGKISGFDVQVENLYKIDPSYIPFFAVENLFELPVNSGTWYTDLPPGIVVGPPVEVDCTYCLTSFIKIAFTIVKPQPPAIAGQANIFDRFTDKLRDIIPIHVRDILFEIKTFILCNEHDNMLVHIGATEDVFTPASMWARFDVVPADCVPCDNRGFVNGTVDLITV